MWAKVMCHFRCEGCQRRSPLNHLDTDGEVSCLRCGERNDFDAGQWLDAIDHAEACAREGGGELRAHGEDRLVPHRIRQKTLVTRATGGHPTCRRCAAALTVVRCKVGMLVVACSASASWSRKKRTISAWPNTAARWIGIQASSVASCTTGVLASMTISGSAVLLAPSGSSQSFPFSTV